MEILHCAQNDIEVCAGFFVVNTYESSAKIFEKKLKKLLTNRSRYYIVVITKKLKKSCKTVDAGKFRSRFCHTACR